MSRDNKGLRVKARGPLPPMVILCIISAAIMVLQDHAFYPRPPTDSCEDQRLVICPQPLNQGHELAIEGQPAAFIWGCCRGGAVMEARRRAPLQCSQRSSQVGPGSPLLALDAGREGVETLRDGRIASSGSIPDCLRNRLEGGIGMIL